MYEHPIIALREKNYIRENYKYYSRYRSQLHSHPYISSHKFTDK